MTSLSTFMKNLLSILHERMLDNKKEVHLVVAYGYRPYMNTEKDRGKQHKPEKSTTNSSSKEEVGKMLDQTRICPLATGPSDNINNNRKLRCHLLQMKTRRDTLNRCTS